MYAVILAGGKGTRFWPYSREERPKQFLEILGDESMLRVTYNRLTDFIDQDRIFLLTVADQLPLVQEELPELRRDRIFAEPVGRNTAPSLAVAAELVKKAGGDSPFLCCPSDHLIKDEASFRELVTAAFQAASESDVMITFGVRPTRPATGYGYIEAGGEVRVCDGHKFYQVMKFHEKPGREKAETYCSNPEFYWNSGIFMWRPSVFLSAWAKFLDEGIGPLSRIAGSLGGSEEQSTIESEYPSMPEISVDYGILEKAGNVIVAPAEFGWDDVGSWDALFDILPVDQRGNVSDGDVELIDSSGNLFYNRNGLTAAVGVSDTIVVVDDGIVLVCKRGQSQRVRELLESMRSKGIDKVL